MKGKLFASFCDTQLVCVALQTSAKYVELKCFCYIVLCLETRYQFRKLSRNNFEKTIISRNQLSVSKDVFRALIYDRTNAEPLTIFGRNLCHRYIRYIIYIHLSFNLSFYLFVVKKPGNVPSCLLPIHQLSQDKSSTW